MLAVALTGGIGAGKSTALEAFAALGAATLSCDDVVHELLRYDEEVRDTLRDRFGDEILDAHGQIDRAALGQRVFNRTEDLEFLESVLHPRVIRQQRRFREQLAASSDPTQICVIEVPLLYEVSAEGRFDKVVVITAPAKLRWERAGDRIDEREERLLSEAEKVRRGDYVYSNDGTLAELEAFVADVTARLRAELEAEE